MQYAKQIKYLTKICSAMGLNLEYVGHNILKDYVGMNSGAAAQIGFNMPNRTIYILRGLTDKIKFRTLSHELIEYKLIKERGYGYWKAHCIALQHEDKFWRY